VHVRWSANSEPDLAGYLVYRALAAGGAFTRLTSSPIAATDYLDAPAPDTLSAWYAVSAVDATGNESARSAPCASTSAAAESGRGTRARRTRTRAPSGPR